MIHVKSLSKTYRVHRRPPGLGAALRSLVRRNYEDVHALREVSFAIAPGERVGFLGPIHVFKGALRVVFTVVFPLALMTTYPAQALLGTLTLAHALYAGAGGLLFTALARFIWQQSLRSYSSASS